MRSRTCKRVSAYQSIGCESLTWNCLFRFTTCGDEALSFDFFKFGAPDPNLLRENDMRLTLRMASVQYVHTKRFQTELVVFFQHYLQLQEVLGRMRAVSAGNEVRRRRPWCTSYVRMSSFRLFAPVGA